MKRKIEDFSSYTMLLIRHGLLSPRATPSDAWGVWTQVCCDRVVMARCKKRLGRNWCGEVSSYAHAGPVIAAMDAKSLTALKNRLGIRPQKEFAVL